jgi:anti-sigma regulatory factor (Ser/Thr protein kinase)
VTPLLTLEHDSPHTSDVATFRRALRAAAHAAGTTAALDDLELVAAELVANAVVHARTPVRLQAWMLDGGGVRLRVRDWAPALLPPPIEDAALAETGRGLMVVAAVTSRWGWQVDEDGTTKSVWAELTA